VRIAVLRALGLGDLLTAVPALRALRDAHPEATLLLACPQPLHELVRYWRLAEPVPARPLEALPASARGAALAVNLHGRGPESTRLLLAARPTALIAFRHPAVSETSGLPSWLDGEHEVVRWCRLLSETGLPASPDRLALEPPPLPAELIQADRATVIHPGAADEARRWPWRRWAAVARGETETGERVFVTGSSGERALCERIARAARIPSECVLAGRTSLLELAAVIGNAALLLSGDTGAAHLATAFGTPSVVLFGPVPPSEWGPPPERAQHRTLWARRRGDPHARTVDPGLLRLTPARVRQEVETLREGRLTRRRRAGRTRDRRSAGA
jgi:ADP-heptose:LPS heptosyltransferase